MSTDDVGSKDEPLIEDIPIEDISIVESARVTSSSHITRVYTSASGCYFKLKTYKHGKPKSGYFYLDFLGTNYNSMYALVLMVATHKKVVHVVTNPIDKKSSARVIYLFTNDV